MKKMSVHTQLLPHLRCELELDIPLDKVFVLAGENGIGKSTLLKYLSSKLPESVLCEQKNLEHFFERPLSQFKKILLKSSLLNHELFDQFWKTAGFEEKEARPVISLSGGESQLLKLILHAASAAEIYFFDEPGQYLDRNKKQIASELLKTLLRNGKRVIVVEHEQSWLPVGSEVTELENCEGILRRRKSWTI